MYKILLFLNLVFSSVVLYGQGIQLNIDYDKPTRELGHVYQGVPAYSISYISLHDNATVSYHLGYHRFKPKADTLYYLIDDGEDFGTASFTNYQAFSGYIGYQYNLNITEPLKAFGGFYFGAYYSHFMSETNDKHRHETKDLHEQNFYFAPRVGLSWDISELLLASIQSKYNFFAPTGKNDARTPAFNDGRVGLFNQSWSTGLAIAIKF